MALSATVSALGAGGSFLRGVGAIGSMFSRGGGTDVAASKELSRYNMELNKDYTQWLNENGYRQMRKGLENADYNPMLALGASPQQGSIAASTAVEGNQVNPLNAVSALNTVANTKLQEQQAETEFAKRENLKADTGMKLVDRLYKEGLIKWQDRQNYADLVLKNTQSQMNVANTKYTNERARGYSESDSHSYSGNGNFGVGPFSGGLGGTVSQSTARTY